MFSVVIVEDNPMVAMLNRKYTEKDPRFQITGEYHDAKTALEHIPANPPDLLILDVFLPPFSGLELLRELRGAGLSSDVIMVTAAGDGKTVDRFLKLGVMDYLVKPFTLQRFQQALDRFCLHRETAWHGSIKQSELDQLLFSAPSPLPETAAAPKGLQPKTLDLLRNVLRQRPGVELTCEEISEAAGLSVVTVRRYMNYLVEKGDAASRINYDTGGRPCSLYRCRS